MKQTRLVPSTHAVSGETMVEVWHGETLIGAIYPEDTRGVRIVSKYDMTTQVDERLTQVDERFPRLLRVHIAEARG